MSKLNTIKYVSYNGIYYNYKLIKRSMSLNADDLKKLKSEYNLSQAQINEYATLIN